MDESDRDQLRPHPGDLGRAGQAPRAETEETVLFGGSKAADAALAYLPLFPDLEHVDLEQTSVTDAGMVHLTKLPKLDGLVLVGTRVTAAGLRTLQKCSETLHTVLR